MVKVVFSILCGINGCLLQSPVEEILRSPVVPTNNIPNENMIDENDTLNLDLTMENHQLLMCTVVIGEGGESSSSLACPVSGLITYSGPIPFFAAYRFVQIAAQLAPDPCLSILQNEWNNSHVRMAKAHQRHLQKHRGWRQKLIQNTQGIIFVVDSNDTENIMDGILTLDGCGSMIVFG
ncbi:kinesin-related protein 8-like protein [Tanacetum coccineum]